jgi:hypothetical protein
MRYAGNSGPKVSSSGIVITFKVSIVHIYGLP